MPALLDALGNTDLLEPLRTVPGVEVVQTGARGGTTSLFVRGGASNFTKVLIDGVPANDIGGAFDFSDLAATGVERVEVLRGSNSVMYGSDALTGVINITTRRGASRVPEATLSLDGGNLGTSRGDASLGGGDRRASTTSPRSRTCRPTTACRTTRIGTTRSPAGSASSLGTTTSVSGTVRHIDSSYGSPNAFDYFGIADDSSQTRTTTYASIAAESQLSPRWTSTRPVQRRRSALSLREPVADRIAFGSIGVRQLSRRRHDDHRRQWLQRDGPGDSRLRRRPIPRHSIPPSRGGCCMAKPSSASRRRWISRAACASRTSTAHPARLSKTARTNCRRVRRGARADARTPLRQRRPRLRRQRHLRRRVDAARVGRRVSAAAIRQRRVRRHQGHLQRRQRHQGTEPRSGTVIAVRARASRHRDNARARADWSGAKPERRRRHGAGAGRRPRTGPARLLRQRVRQSDRVREQRRPAAARRAARGRGGGVVRRLPELPVQHVARRRTVGRGAHRPDQGARVRICTSTPR